MARSIRIVPAKISTLADGTKIKCSVGKSYSAEEIKQGALSFLGVMIFALERRSLSVRSDMFFSFPGITLEEKTTRSSS